MAGAQNQNLSTSASTETTSASGETAATSTSKVLDTTGALASTGLTATTTDTNGLKTAQVLHPDTSQLVNLQLNALDQPRVQWRGEVWPGQQMEWEVRDDGHPAKDAQRGAQQDEENRNWQSTVRFDLPTLGKVSATINLVGDRVQMQVRVANPVTANTLRSFGPRLSEALDAAGSRLESLSVKQDEQA